MALYSDIEQKKTKTQVLNEDVASVYQSIGNILNTRKTERFFNPEFGSKLDELLFEPMDAVTKAKIYRFIIDAIEEWEPRVKLDYGKSHVTSIVDEHKYEITLIFSIKGLPGDSFNFSGILEQPN